MREIERDIASGVIVSADDQVLLGVGTPGGVYAGHLHIPGGGVEAGETELQAFRREVLLETGLDVSDCEPEVVEDGATGDSEKILRETGERVLVHMRFTTYRVRLSEQASDVGAVAGEDLTELTWAALPIDPSEYKLAPPTEALFRQLGYIAT